MAKRLTDRQKKKIIADYAETENLAETSRKNKVSRDTVKRIVNSSPQSAEIAAKKKEQNTLDMIAYMDSRKDKAQTFVDMCFDALLNKDKISSAQLSQITTAMGTVIDKFAAKGGAASNGSLSDAVESAWESRKHEH